MSNKYWNDPWDKKPARPRPQPPQDDRFAPRREEAPAREAPAEGKRQPPPYRYPLKKRPPKPGAKSDHRAVLLGLLVGVLCISLLFSGMLGYESAVGNSFQFSFSLETEDEEEESPVITESAEDEEDAEEETSLPTLAQAELNPDVQLTLLSWAELEELSYEEVYAANIASVVSIVCYLDDYSGATGTGIVIHSDGYIVTNQHVIEDAVSCYAILDDGDYYEAALVGMDEETDLAVLKIEASGLSAARFGDSDELVVGNACVAIGDPLGVDFRGTMTTGIISALNRNVEVNGYTMTLIQTDCAINSGNSGGPLINMYGLVVGICNMKMMSSGTTVEGLGFAIPSNTIKTVVNKLLATGEVQKAMLGITAQTLTTAQCREYGIECGILVVTVSESSDAFLKGIEPGDIIVAADGVSISTVTELNNLKGDMYPGDYIILTVLRDGEYTDYYVRLMQEDEVY